MNKRIKILIVILILGVLMIGFGVFIMNFDNKKKEDSKTESNENLESDDNLKPDEEITETPDEEEKSEEYKEAYDIAVSLYEYDDRTVELEEKEDKFVICVKDKDGNIINIFYMDKETGDISEQPRTETIPNNS